MCCATGVCGPSVKKELIQTTAIQRHVNADGENIIIRRNLTQNPDAFVRNHQINDLLKKYGITVLPITMVNGIILNKEIIQPSKSFQIIYISLSRAFVR